MMKFYRVSVTISAAEPGKNVERQEIVEGLEMVKQLLDEMPTHISSFTVRPVYVREPDDNPAKYLFGRNNASANR